MNLSPFNLWWNRPRCRHSPAPSGRHFIWPPVLALFLASLFCRADLVGFPDLGLRVQRGFSIREIAQNDLAPDTWCLAFDPFGRLVVGNGQSIRTLTDTDGDGVVDHATVFATVTKGVMGLCFDGPYLYAMADGGLMRFIDANGDSVADGPGERIAVFGFGEHGGHAIRKGPDGALYVIGGNDADIGPQHISIPESPVFNVEAGAIVRFNPDGTTECVAHGFRNCYDFDFNALGDIFTYDSDTERDMFLPWYVPTRLYQVGIGQHHGWRLRGYLRSWPRPDYYEDTVDILSHVGRGSPTGVTTYRHTQFPPAYRDGMFFCDWTFGRIYFAPLNLQGAGYAAAQPEVFIEPTGLHGFAPTSIAVSADGALYVSIGGRKTRGAVYRIAFNGRSAPGLVTLADLELNMVLAAPQPLEAWSRSAWQPVAQRLGAQPFAAVAMDESFPSAARIRAIEVLTEMFGGLPPVRVPSLSQTRDPLVRARVAWSLGRLPPDNASSALGALALDSSPLVRRCALDAMIENPDLIHSAVVSRAISANLANADKRVRMAATRLASRVPAETWQIFAETLRASSPSSRAAGLLAEIWRSHDSTFFPQVIPQLTNILAQSRDASVRLDVVRLAILALGDWHLNNPTVEVFAGYEPSNPPGPEFAALIKPVRALLPSGNPDLDAEGSRLLAMLQDDDPRIARTIAEALTDRSSATQDFHYLVCLARMRAPLNEYAPRIAHAVLNLDRKLAGQESRLKQTWDGRLTELVQQFVQREPAIGDALLRHPRFALPAHVHLAASFSGPQRTDAARRFAIAVRQPAFPWTTPLVELLSALPREEIFPLYRRHAANAGVRDAIVLKLAEEPAPGDRQLFLGSLASSQPQVVRASVGALLKLPPDAANTNLVAPLRLLRRSFSEPQEILLRSQLLAFLSTSLKQPFKVQEPSGGDVDDFKAAYKPLFDWIATKYPGLIRAINQDDGQDPARWAAIMRGIPWTKGDSARGENIFSERGCAACHGQAAAIGPDLAGSVQRMSPQDLMTAIAFPSRDIAPAYRPTIFRLRDGQVINGMVAFESADGWLVQTGAGMSARLDSRDVLSREPSNISLMPAGLLEGLTPLAIADLYEYLRSLQAKP